MIAATVALLLAQPAPPASVDWVAQGEATLAAKKASAPITGRAKNVILFVADGMDVTTVTAARIHEGQLMGGSGEEHSLSFETLPNLALAKTYNTNMQTPDSAGTATAMVTGQKTKAGVISVDQTVARGDCAGSKGHELPTMMDLAAAHDRVIGVVSTARITHATPATVYAHAADRNWEADRDLPTTATECKDIATQLVDAVSAFPLKLALGGGRRNFLPNTMTDPEYADGKGARRDGVDLTQAWVDADDGNAFIWNKEQFEALVPGKASAVLGLFEPSHMQYDSDRAGDKGGEPSLAEMTGFAIEHLSTNEDGFFLMVEAGRVDHAHHGGNARRALEDAIAFDEAVAVAMENTDPQDTLIIATSDHGHTLVFQGYPQRGNPILGTVVSAGRDGSPGKTPYPAADGKPYTTLAYGNGPGSPFMRKPPEGMPLDRPFVSTEEAQELDYRQQAAIPSPSETHGGQDVAIYARGPMAHYINGVVEQNFIYFVMREALTADAD